MTLTIMPVETRARLNREKLKNNALKQKQLRSRVHEFFTRDDPYYRDMLEMVARQNEENQKRAERLEMLQLEQGEIDSVYGVNAAKVINRKRMAVQAQRRREE